ncbi:uncharacterized protein N0V89_011420 [Didymosphaeria variabile]|uniref:SMP domain-containing protein n=1 Tax=Didymosphaeria variabile TaxID=1932322 RepID=A0A9W8X9Q6_9PLEO|nr:uncharacterized protein N0V89_011420 [Didymosphaeria variabile]KAJ4345290.1 hypothetical protein N0V89_011420 [Didymosphaeria variabile]
MSKRHSHFAKVLNKLKTDPLSITPEDARRLSEQVEVTDRRSAKIVSAVESLAMASEDIQQQLDPQTNSPPMVQVPSHTQHNLVNDLKAAVDNHPDDVTADLLKATQDIVSTMQRAVGAAHAPNPELEDDLQKELARIGPKVEAGTVTKAEADRLHSLKARAHGHTEKGGLIAQAQSVAAKRERTQSLSDSTNDGQIPTDSSNISKDQSQSPATSDTSGKFAALSLVENKPKDSPAPKVDSAHHSQIPVRHTRKGSEQKAVEAH